MEIQQPDFDELATGELADVEERGTAHIEDKHYEGIAQLGTTVGTYWASLRAMDVPAKHATRLTREWMGINAWGVEED